jgi:hypothetical protein
VYESEQDERYKLTVITRVWQGERLLGLLGASLAVDSRLVALDMQAEWPGVRVVGPMDENPRLVAVGPGEVPRRFVVVLEAGYGIPGQKPHEVGPEECETLAAFVKDLTLRQAANACSGNGCLVSFARVGDSHFVAMVERPYPWPLGLILRQPLGYVIGFGLMLAFLGMVRRWYRRQHQPSTGVGDPPLTAIQSLIVSL